MSTATAAPIISALPEDRIAGYVSELLALSGSRSRVQDSWGAVSAQLTADALLAAIAASRSGSRVGNGVHVGTVDIDTAFPTAADLVAAQRVVIAAQLTPEAARIFWSLLPLIPHLESVRCPDTRDAAAGTAEMLGGLEFPERQTFLRSKAATLAAVAELLRASNSQEDYVRAVYRSDLFVFELALIDVAAETGDQHLSTARVKMQLAQAALVSAAGQRRFHDAASAVALVRRILTWALLGSRDQLEFVAG